MEPVALLELIPWSALFAFFMTAGKVSMALKSLLCRPYISLEMFFVTI